MRGRSADVSDADTHGAALWERVVSFLETDLICVCIYAHHKTIAESSHSYVLSAVQIKINAGESVSINSASYIVRELWMRAVLSQTVAATSSPEHDSLTRN